MTPPQAQPNKEMISARNSIDMHVQDFMQNDELLLPILQTFTQSTCSLYATPNAVCIQFGQYNGLVLPSLAVLYSAL